MTGLPKKLNEIKDLRRSLYADGITLRTATGSDGHIEDTHHTAVEVAEENINTRGLTCLPEKSELFIYQPYRSRIGKDQTQVEARTKGARIPRVDKIRILGVWLQSNGRHSKTLKSIETGTQQTIRLIRCITSRKTGMKDANLLWLVQAFIISRRANATPYLHLTKCEKEKKVSRRLLDSPTAHPQKGS